MEKEGFAKSLAEARKEHKLSQAKLGKLLEVPLPTIIHWEAGNRIPPPYVQRLLLAYIRNLPAEES